MNTNPDSSPVKGFFCFFNRRHRLGVSRFVYQARSLANERRCIARIRAAKRARDLADPVAERVFRAGLPQCIRIEAAAPSRDWSFGFSVHAHRRLSKSKPRNTVDVPANPRCGGSKFGRASFSSGAVYRRGAA